eukprot:PhM_4_TR9796/c0_g1_i2/m.18846
MGCSPSRSGATSIVASSQPPKKRAIDVYLERQGLRRAGCNPNSSNCSSSSSSTTSSTESADESPGTGTFVSTTVDLVSMYNPVLWMGTESFFPPVARQPQHGTKQRACTFNNVDDKELAKVPSLRRLSSANIHASFKRQGTKVFGQSNNTDTWDVVTDDDGHFQLKYPGPLGGWKREDKNIGYHVREIVLTHRRTLSSVHLTLGRCRTEDGGVRIPTLDDLASDVGAIPNVDNVELKYQNEQNNQENKYEKNDRNHHGSSNSSRRNSNSSSSSHVSEEGDNVCGDSGQNVIARSYVAYTVDRPSSFEKQALSSKVLGSAVVWSAVDIVRHAVGDGDDDEYEGDDEQEGGHDNDDDYAGGNNTHSNNENENINENYNDNNNNSTTSPSPSNMNNGRSFVVCQGRDDIDNDDDDEDFMTHIEGARFVGPEGWSYFDVTFVAAEDDWRVIGDVFSTIHSTLEMGWN